MDREVILEDEFVNHLVYGIEERQTRIFRRRLYTVVGIVIASIIVGIILGCQIASSKTSASAPGHSRLFEVTVGNLDGDESKTGTFSIRTRHDWAPIGVDRVHDLIASDFYTDCRFFRVLPGFVTQFGINGDPFTENEWDNVTLPDDPVVASNVKGTISFATSGANSRTTQLFINLDDNVDLDQQGFAPIGEVVQGMDTVERIYSKWKQQPDQRKILTKGNEYLQDNFPGLSFIISITAVLE